MTDKSLSIITEITHIVETQKIAFVGTKAEGSSLDKKNKALAGEFEVALSTIEQMMNPERTGSFVLDQQTIDAMNKMSTIVGPAKMQKISKILNKNLETRKETLIHNLNTATEKCIKLAASKILHLETSVPIAERENNMSIEKMLKSLQTDAKNSIKNTFENISLENEIADFALNEDNAKFMETLEDIAKNGNRKDPLTKKAKNHKAIKEVLESKQKAETVRDCVREIRFALEKQSSEAKGFVEIEKALNILTEIEKEYAKIATKAYSGYEKLGISGIETSVKIQQHAKEREDENKVSDPMNPVIKEYTRLVENALKAEQGLLENIALENIGELWKRANDFALQNKISENDKEIIIRKVDDEVKIQKEAFEKEQMAKESQAEDARRAQEEAEAAKKAKEEHKAMIEESKAADAQREQDRIEVEKMEEADRIAKAAEVDQIAVNNLAGILERIVIRDGLGVEKAEREKLAELYIEFQKPGIINSGISFEKFYEQKNNGQSINKEVAELLNRFENPDMHREDDGMGGM